MANKIKFAISNALAVHMTSHKAAAEDPHTIHLGDPLSKLSENLSDQSIHLTGLSDHISHLVSTPPPDVESIHLGALSAQLVEHTIHLSELSSNLSDFTIHLLSAPVAANPLHMMTKSQHSEATIVSIHGLMSINLPEAQKVSRVEFGRDENGDLIVILHE